MTSRITESSPERLLRLPEVISQTGLNRNSIYQIEDFPKPIKIGARATAWVQSEIQLWIKSTIEKQR
jgi:prophage regulatory protein